MWRPDYLPRLLIPTFAGSLIVVDPFKPVVLVVVDDDYVSLVHRHELSMFVKTPHLLLLARLLQRRNARAVVIVCT